MSQSDALAAFNIAMATATIDEVNPQKSAAPTKHVTFIVKDGDNPPPQISNTGPLSRGKKYQRTFAIGQGRRLAKRKTYKRKTYMRKGRKKIYGRSYRRPYRRVRYAPRRYKRTYRRRAYRRRY